MQTASVSVTPKSSHSHSFFFCPVINVFIVDCTVNLPQIICLKRQFRFEASLNSMNFEHGMIIYRFHVGKQKGETRKILFFFSVPLN